jgi:hypothetical protein
MTQNSLINTYQREQSRHGEDEALNTIKGALYREVSALIEASSTPRQAGAAFLEIQEKCRAVMTKLLLPSVDFEVLCLEESDYSQEMVVAIINAQAIHFQEAHPDWTWNHCITNAGILHSGIAAKAMLAQIRKEVAEL